MNSDRTHHVAFSAYQSKAKSYKLHETWIFDEVLLNEGNAYNKATGTFIAPSGGTYAFTWSTLTYPRKTAHPYLRVNGHYKGFTAFNNSHTSQSVWSSGSNTIFVRLKKGDRVDLLLGTWQLMPEKTGLRSPAGRYTKLFLCSSTMHSVDNIRMTC
ncbi:heavy metal-binding protein HIP-like [Saccostrea cucullata]|uniref:heavy metal-binding protein HIP-like n=1 Tax=Saccostrea cuccullata TaxID=36930 RepID=UPI002ED2B0B6